MARTRKGRPRKARDRHRNGHLKRAPAVSLREIAAAMPHRRGLGEQATSQLAETELGRMCLRGEIARELYLAGETFAGQWRAYVGTLGGPQVPKNGQGRGFACDGCPVPESRKFCKCDHIRRICGETLIVLSMIGWPAQRAVQTVVIHDRQCPWDAVDALWLGLSTLAQHFGLTKHQIVRQKTQSERIAPRSA